MSDKRLVARWESRGGAHWVEAYVSGDSRETGSYRAIGTCGYPGTVGASAIIQHVQTRVNRGDFQPDKARTPMRLIFNSEDQSNV